MKHDNIRPATDKGWQKVGDIIAKIAPKIIQKSANSQAKQPKKEASK